MKNLFPIKRTSIKVIIIILILTLPIWGFFFLLSTNVMSTNIFSDKKKWLCEPFLAKEPIAMYNPSKSLYITQKIGKCSGFLMHYIYLHKVGYFTDSEDIIFEYAEQEPHNDYYDTMNWVKWENDSIVELNISPSTIQKIGIKAQQYNDINILYPLLKGSAQNSDHIAR